MLPLDKLPDPPAANRIGLLSGISVLDLTTSIAGPYAAMLLGDMGADVIKIERPGSGDDCRAWGPPFLDEQSLWFLSVNRNKRSVTLDYGNERGLKVLHELVKRVDVVIINLVDRVQRKLGIDYDTLSRLKPGLIFVSITGFGLQGARKDFPCYDLIAEGYSGVMDLTGEAESPPQKVGTPAADVVAGMDAAFAVAAALVDRGRTGRGHKIDIAMVDSMTRFMSARIVPYLGSGEVPKRTGARDSVIAVYQTFDTADFPITLGLGNDGIWKRFWEAVGRPEVGQDPRYSSNAARRNARAEIVAEIQKVLLTRPRNEWLGIFVAASVPAGPVNRVDQVAADEELIKRGLFFADHREGQRAPQVGLGISIDDNNACYRLAPPRLGQHTDEVLRDLLGYSDSALAELRGARVI